MKFDPRPYVDYWLHKKKITIDERGNLNSADKRDMSDLFDTLFLDYLEDASAHNRVADKEVKSKVYKQGELQMALNEVISLEMHRRRQEIVAKLACTGPNLAPLEQFVTASTGNCEARIVAVLAHFLWMVKRKMLDKEVVWHIMPILYGPQGSGKTYAIKKLIEPLGNMTLEMRVSEIVDSRFQFALNNNYIAFLDELAGAQKTEVEVLKNQITATHNDSRKLGKNKVYKIKQNVSLIGATNRPVSEIIYDPTGARRFYEITTLQKMDWLGICAIDYLALYRGIDENLARGYLEPYLQEIAKDQEALVMPDEIATFVEHHNINIDGKTREIACNTVYDIYVLWAEANGMKPLNSNWFGRKFINKGIPGHQRRVGNKTARFYMINEESSIHRKSLIGDPLAVSTK